MPAVGRAFGLRDVPLVYSLQRSGAPLDLESAIVEPIRPLTTAMRNYLGQMVGQQREMTFVVRGQRDGQKLRGFVQMRTRLTRPEADIVFLAPSLGGRRNAASRDVWEELLSHACQQAGMQQRQRVFAKLRAGDSDSIEAFRRVGFTIYAQEMVYRLDRLPVAVPPTLLSLRPYETRDNWGIQRLFCHAAPRGVQQVECQAGQGWALPGVSLERRAQRLVWEVTSEVRGYVSLRRGVHGHWLRVLIDHDDRENAEALILTALAHIGPSLRPVYSSVRGYEPDLQYALQHLGFRQQAEQLLMVKTTVVPIKEPVLAWLPVPERGVEAAPTTSRLHSSLDKQG